MSISGTPERSSLFSPARPFPLISGDFHSLGDNFGDSVHFLSVIPFISSSLPVAFLRVFDSFQEQDGTVLSGVSLHFEREFYP